MTDQSWKYGVEVTGVDEALAKLNTLRASFAQNIEQTKTAASATSEVTSADQQMLAVMTRVANAIEQQNSAQKKLNDAVKEHGAASVDTTLKIQQFSAGLAQIGSVVSSTNPALGQMLTHTAALGPMLVEAGRATTAFGSIISVGPAALTVGLELWAANAARVEANTNAVAAAADTASASVRNLAAALRDQLQAQHDQARLAAGQGTQLEYQAQLNDLLRRRSEITRRLTDDQLNYFGANDAFQRNGQRQLDELRAQIQEVTRLRDEQQRGHSGVIVEETGGIASDAEVAAAREAAGQGYDSDKRKASMRASAGGRGGGRSSADATNPKAEEIALLEKQAAAQRALDDAELAGRQKIQQATELAAQAERDERQARITEEKRGYEVALEHEHALAEAKKARIREVEALSRAAHERDMRQQQELLAAISSMAQTTSGFFNLIADSEGKSAKAQKEASIIRLVGQGTNEVINSAIDFATAIGSTVENPVLAATKYLSGGLHAANAVRAFELAGKGGEAAAAPSSGAGAASSQTSGVPSRFDAGARPGGTGGSGTVVINVGTFPVSTDVQVGDAVLRALQAHARTNGATFQRAA